MSEQQGSKPLGTTTTQGPSEDFAAYCEAEFERRRNTGEAFNESDYREAMEMTVRRLQVLEDEGYA